jgi:putative salt-induced outer membrane protein
VIRGVAILILCSMAGTTLAQAPAPADPFVGSAALGYLSTSGNTEATNLNSLLKITWDLDGPWKHDWTALAIRASSDDVTTAEAYAAGYKAMRDFSATSYLFFSSSRVMTGR